MQIEDYITLMLTAATLGFITRTLSGVANTVMAYTKILGFVRFYIAKAINPGYMRVAIKGKPEMYNKYDQYFEGVYNVICKESYLMRFICCPLCQSVWLVALIPFVLGYTDPKIYLLTLCFNHVYFGYLRG